MTPSPSLEKAQMPIKSGHCWVLVSPVFVPSFASRPLLWVLVLQLNLSFTTHPSLSVTLSVLT